MTLIPDEQLQTKASINLAPMVDFLFLVLCIFVVVALTRSNLLKTEVSLSQSPKNQEDAQLKPLSNTETIHLIINDLGQYKWLSESESVLIQNIQLIQEKIREEKALSPQKEKIKILLHIDKHAPWDPIAQAIVAIREVGAEVHPVYESQL